MRHVNKQIQSANLMARCPVYGQMCSVCGQMCASDFGLCSDYVGSTMAVISTHVGTPCTACENDLRTYAI